ncbi:hypothetical protein [Paracoccus sp. KR1-242]|uniref:hypothetical protein n=1 Tax=Paracoccus sp. KR1-242 TaxID=3410028 RepID=UPI003C029FB5
MAVLQQRGLSQTFLNDVTRGDRAWTRDYRTRDPRVGTFDAVFARLSAIWPKDLAWPEDIPRPPPSEVEPEVMAEIADRLTKSASSNMEHDNG